MVTTIIGGILIGICLAWFGLYTWSLIYDYYIDDD